MADVVRISLDVVVDKGDPAKVAEVLYEHGEEILGFATSVVLVEDEKTSEMEIRKAARGSHVHDPESEGGRCTQCVRYAGRELLSVVQSFEG
jgi:hypothetical protein